MNSEIALHIANNTSISAAGKNTQVAVSDNLYTKALVNGTPMLQLHSVDRMNHVLACVQSAIFIGGWNKKDDEDLKATVRALMPDINGRFKLFTEKEVRLAFENGAKGYYGESFGVSVASCIHWLNAFQQDVNRVNAKKELEAAAKSAYRPPMSRGQRQAFINTAFQTYLDTGIYNDHGNAVYDMLDKERMINYTAAQKNAYVERGRVIVYNRLQVWRDLQEKKENEKKMAELIESDTTAIIEAKRLALMDYFGALKGIGAKKVCFVNTCLKF